MNSSNSSLRLNKYLAEQMGVSRRQADQMIKKGEIFINGEKVLQPAVFVEPKQDNVRRKNKRIHSIKKSFIYLMLNKPSKVLTTTQDPKGRPIVMDYIHKMRERVFPVGRLDWDSEGLLLFTNDGEFSSSVLQPKNKIPKTYLVKVQGQPSEAQIQRLVRGVSTPVGRRQALFAKKHTRKASSNVWIKIIISEGKKRQIRLMFDKLGFPVQKLRRVAVGRLKMNKLTKGVAVRLSEQDIKKIFQKPKELVSYRKHQIKPRSGYQASRS